MLGFGTSSLRVAPSRALRCPRGLRLMGHQETAVRRALEDPRLALLMDTGTGKTITVFSLLYQHVGTFCPTLVLAPKSVALASWPDDAARFGEAFRVTVCLGTPAKRRALRAATLGCEGSDASGPAEILVTSYESFRMDSEAYVALAKAGRIKTLVLDESTKVKAPGAKVSRAVRAVSSLVPRCHILSGCHIPNDYSDIWGQFYCVDPSVFGRSFITFRHKYFFQPNPQWSKWLWRMKPAVMYPPNGAQEEIDRLVASRSFQVTKEDCLDLPKQTFQVRRVELTPAERRNYDLFKQHLVLQVAGGEVVGTSLLAEIMALRIFTAGLVHVKIKPPSDPGADLASVWDRRRNLTEDRWETIGDTKLRELQGISDDVGLSRPLLVLGQFRREIDRAAEFLEKRCHRKTRIIYGSTSDRDRQDIIRAFNYGTLGAIVGHPGAMAHGLNLQRRCADTVWLSMDWSYERFKQSCDRVYRHAQTRSVTHHLLVAKDTIDERILEVVRRKRSLTADEAADFLGVER